jgi:pyruvate,water dikinase
LGRLDVDFERFDLTGNMQELERFEPNVHLAHLHQVYSALDEDLQARIRDSRYKQLPALPGAEPLRRGTVEFLDRFGHLSDSGNDFSHQPWRENPDLILQMITNYIPFEGDVGERVQLEDLPLPALRRRFFRSIYHRARRFRWYREATSSLYTFGYGLFRDHFLALADHFVRRGLLAQRGDIFYLYLDEVRQMVEAGPLAQGNQALIQERKDKIKRAQDLTPPDILYGDQAPPLDPNPGRELKGIPTSRGHYTGPVRVLQGIGDFDKLRDGDVLVIPYSDVGWTPLFTRAGAVIAESGGILSHSSIIAREYGIPAVVSVPGACQIPDGVRVTVDGYQGDIVVHEAADAEPGS